jgi:SHS2 domain-containing protein
MPYRFLEELATADIAFIAEGNTLAETFTAAADATLNVMVETLDAIFPRETKEFALDNERLDLLLFDFLQELIYYKDAQKLMLRVGRVQIKEKEGKFFLRATVRGERLDPERHHPRVDVKAVTLHRFRLEKTDRGWEAFVILDI